MNDTMQGVNLYLLNNERKIKAALDNGEDIMPYIRRYQRFLKALADSMHDSSVRTAGLLESLSDD